ncbi:MAG: P-II family nitrogen regulator [Candidatus Margulisbacteria bacterium]|nr:P-II family nitrogen regulator [Candidatus Margulisiibacteriota bacterium]
MKLITAFIKDFKLDEVTLALNEIERLAGMTVQEVRGHGRTRGKETHIYQEPVSDFVKKVRIDLYVQDDIAEQVVDTLQKSAHTGLMGDGKIYVQSVDEAVRISSNERGEKAL